MKAISILAGLLMLAVGGPALAASAPAVSVQADAPGWITVYYNHSATDGALWFTLQRQDSAAIFQSSAPTGQFTDTNLKPNTAYTYRACAIYQDEAQPVCSGWSTARTQPLGPPPANYDPPTIINTAVATDSISVTWGATGTYQFIQLRIDNPQGNLGQFSVKNVANGSYLFRGLQPGVRYHVFMQGCSHSLLGAGCGSWSSGVWLSTASPPTPLMPPGKPTVRVRAPTTPGVVSLDFSVNVAQLNSSDVFTVLRNGAQVARAAPTSASGPTWSGAFSEPVTARNTYQVCFQGFSPPGKTCSDKVVDPATRGSILWYNDATGGIQIWFMSSASRVGRATIVDENARPSAIGLPWRLVGGGVDFNGDGWPDLLWHNDQTGETQMWLMKANAVAGRATVVGETGAPAFIGPPWSIVGTADMNVDGAADIVWHNSQTGETQLWLMKGNRVASRATVLGEGGAPAFVGLPWSIVATGDLSGDGKPDILWHNAQTGESQIWIMNSYRVAARATVVGEGGAPAFVGLPWRITGANDFNGDGAGDILWHNETTGESQIWFLKGHGVALRQTVDANSDGGGAMVGPPWRTVNH